MPAEESIQKTNIPTIRKPFGVDLPPKVPFCATANVGNRRSPVYVKNKQILECDPLSSFLMFTPIWLDYKPSWIKAGEELEWVASDGTYHVAKDPAGSGTGNENLWKIYKHLLDDYNNATDKTEHTDTYTSGTNTYQIKYRLANDKHKICLSTTSGIDDALDNVFNAADLGEAWYYVINTSAKSFKLPRTRYGFHGNLSYVKFGQLVGHEMFLYFNTGVGQAD